MKHLAQYLFIFTTLFCSFKSTAQTNGRYLYIEIRGLSLQRGYPELQKELIAFPQIKSTEYCPEVGLLIVETVSSTDSIHSELNRLLHSLSYHYTIKSSIPYDEARKICDRKMHH